MVVTSFFVLPIHFILKNKNLRFNLGFLIYSTNYKFQDCLITYLKILCLIIVNCGNWNRNRKKRCSWRKSKRWSHCWNPYLTILRTEIRTTTDYFFFKNRTGTRTEKILKVPAPEFICNIYVYHYSLYTYNYRLLIIHANLFDLYENLRFVKNIN